MLLFHPNPPHLLDPLLSNLFINRDWEQQHLRDSIEELSAPAVGGQPSGTTIQLIHGESRVGKSHLALHVLHEVARRYFNVFVVQAANGRTAYQILKELYSGVRNQLLVLTHHGPTLEKIRVYDSVTSVLPPQTVEIPAAAAPADTSARATLSRLLGIGRQPEPKPIFLPAADELRLVGIIADICGEIRRITDKRCLLYVDDVDLLDAGPEVDQSQVTPLVRRLEGLAWEPGIMVLASLRTRHLGVFNKEFTDLLWVEPLKDEDLKDIYHKQIHVLNKGKGIFTEVCLDELVRATSGHVGNFLRWCSQFYTWGKRRLFREKRDRLLDEDDLVEYAREQMSAFSARPDLARHLDRVRDAVLASRLSVELDPDVMRTNLVNFLVEEPANVGAGIFNINPFMARVLRGAAEPAA